MALLLIIGNGVELPATRVPALAVMPPRKVEPLATAMINRPEPAFVKVRDTSQRKIMQNDARQIGSAAQQYMMEKGVTAVSFDIDAATGRVTGPLSEFSIKVTPGTRAVDGVIENQNDTFSLQNPRFLHGEVETFDAEGQPR